MNYFDTVKPTYIENWPRALCNMSIAQVDIPLTLEEAKDLGKNLTEWGQLFLDEFGCANRDAHRLRYELDQALNVFPNGAFIRLGSRSPKDSFLFYDNPCVTTGQEAWNMITSESERVADDLMLAIKNKYAPHVFVREWIDIPEWTEFRCFMRDRKLVGVSQYNYHKSYSELSQEDVKSSIMWAVERFFEDFRKECHLDDVVFDVFVKMRQFENQRSWEVRLLEINPFGEHTDPCLYDWRNHGDFDGCLRVKQG